MNYSKSYWYISLSNSQFSSLYVCLRLVVVKTKETLEVSYHRKYKITMTLLVCNCHLIHIVQDSRRGRVGVYYFLCCFTTCVTLNRISVSIGQYWCQDKPAGIIRYTTEEGKYFQKRDESFNVIFFSFVICTRYTCF
jgi:hypothetical protein